MKKALTTKQGRLWIQPKGPGTEMHLLSCKDADSIEAPEGGIELVRCFNDSGEGWVVVGEKLTVPDQGSFGITGLLYEDRDYLERITWPYPLYVLFRDMGRADEVNNYVRGQIMTNARRTARTYENVVAREEDNESTLVVPIEFYDLLDIDRLVAERMTTAATLGLNAIAANRDFRPASAPGGLLQVGEDVVAGGLSAVAPGTGDLLFSYDFGQSWAAGTTDPLAAGKDATAVARFMVGRNVFRTLVIKEAEAAAQGVAAFSDDNGATWATSTW